MNQTKIALSCLYKKNPDLNLEHISSLDERVVATST